MEGMEVRTFVGYGYGKFQADDGKMMDYCNVFFLSNFAGEENNDYHFGGVKAEKVKCVSPDVFKDIKVNTAVNCFFDSKGKVSYMVAAK